MITGKFYLKNYADWRIKYFMLTDKDDADYILNCLEDLGCSYRFLRKAEKLLCSNKKNKGITYSKAKLKTTIVVVSKTTNIWEFFNSFAHEVDHIEKHVAKALNFSPYSEKASYLVGEIVRGMFHNIFYRFLC